MTCKELTDFLMDYLDRELPAPVHAAFEQHVQACPPCLSYLDSYKAAVELGQKVCDADDAAPGDVPEELIQAILSATREA